MDSRVLHPSLSSFCPLTPLWAVWTHYTFQASWPPYPTPWSSPGDYREASIGCWASPQYLASHPHLPTSSSTQLQKDNLYCTGGPWGRKYSGTSNKRDINFLLGTEPLRAKPTCKTPSSTLQLILVSNWARSRKRGEGRRWGLPVPIKWGDFWVARCRNEKGRHFTTKLWKAGLKRKTCLKITTGHVWSEQWRLAENGPTADTTLKEFLSCLPLEWSIRCWGWCSNGDRDSLWAVVSNVGTHA